MYQMYENEEISDLSPLNTIDYNNSKTNDLTTDNHFEKDLLTTNYITVVDIFNFAAFHIPIIPIPVKMDQKIPSFIIKKKEENEHQLRGRKRNSLEPNQNIHSKYSPDNALTKIQVHSLSFVIDFSNDVLKEFGYNQKEYFFVNIDSKIKEKVNKKTIAELKKSDIRKILCLNISPKFSTYRKDRNKIIYEKVTENEIIKYLFSINYLELFKYVYYKNVKKYSFKFKNYHGSIDLSNTKTFRDFLNAKAGEDKDYREIIEAIVYNNYFMEDN